MTKDNNILDWDSTIEDDGQGYTLLDEGDYEFTVSGFERGQFNGSEKIPACKKAILTLSFDTGNGVVQIRTHMLLYKTLEWKLSSFFRSIGQKKHGERLVMDWNHVIGCSGMAHVIQRTYTGNDGTLKKTNDIAYFMDHIPSAKQAPAMAIETDEDNIPF